MYQKNVQLLLKFKYGYQFFLFFPPRFDLLPLSDLFPRVVLLPRGVIEDSLPLIVFNSIGYLRQNPINI